MNYTVQLYITMLRRYSNHHLIIKRYHALYFLSIISINCQGQCTRRPLPLLWTSTECKPPSPSSMNSIILSMVSTAGCSEFHFELSMSSRMSDNNMGIFSLNFTVPKKDASVSMQRIVFSPWPRFKIIIQSAKEYQFVNKF